MTAITGDVAYTTTVTVVAASGDGTTIAAMFNGITFPQVSGAAATATNNSGTVTITWPSEDMVAGDNIALTVVTNTLAADTSLTSPITTSVTTAGSLV